MQDASLWMRRLAQFRHLGLIISGFALRSDLKFHFCFFERFDLSVLRWWPTQTKASGTSVRG
jgi:hypothetical protein